jgi:hypothetical protein
MANEEMTYELSDQLAQDGESLGIDLHLEGNA